MRSSVAAAEVLLWSLIMQLWMSTQVDLWALPQVLTSNISRGVLLETVFPFALTGRLECVWLSCLYVLERHVALSCISKFSDSSLARAITSIFSGSPLVRAIASMFSDSSLALENVSIFSDSSLVRTIACPYPAIRRSFVPSHPCSATRRLFLQMYPYSATRRLFVPSCPYPATRRHCVHKFGSQLNVDASFCWCYPHSDGLGPVRSAAF